MKSLILFAVIAVSLGSTAFTTIENPIKNGNTTTICHNLDFTLINETGYNISSIFVSPTTENEWGEDIMGRDLLNDGESVDISFHPGENDKKWDIYVTWEGYEADEDVHWIGFDLSTISEITLFKKKKTGKTWAVTK